MTEVKDTITIGAAGTHAEFTVMENGLINTIGLDIPNWTNNVTANFSIINADGKVIYLSTDNFVRNAFGLKASLAIPVDRKFQISVILGGVPGAGGGDVTVYAYVENRR